MYNINTINGNNNSPFNKSKFLEEIDCSCCLLIDSDVFKKYT